MTPWNRSSRPPKSNLPLWHLDFGLILSVQDFPEISVAGRGKLRGRKYKLAKSVLAITSGEFLAGANIGTVDCVSVNALNINGLAPGADAGRLTVWTEAFNYEVRGGLIMTLANPLVMEKAMVLLENSNQLSFINELLTGVDGNILADHFGEDNH